MYNPFKTNIGSSNRGLPTETTRLKLQRHNGIWHIIEWGETRFPIGKPSEQPLLEDALLYMQQNGYEAIDPLPDARAYHSHNPIVNFGKFEGTAQAQVFAQLQEAKDKKLHEQFERAETIVQDEKILAEVHQDIEQSRAETEVLNEQIASLKEQLNEDIS